MRNLALDGKNRDLIGSYALKDLVNILPSPSAPPPHPVSDMTLCSVLAVLYEIVRASTAHTRTWHELHGTAGLLALAWHPALWLVRSWYAPGYDSVGPFVACAVVALAGWSLRSPRVQPASSSDSRMPMALLLAAAGLRLASEVLAINVLGALLLVVDVYAIARLAGLQQRERALHDGARGARA